MLKKLNYICNKLELNLSNLTIITELGSNEYLYTPIIAALAGAKKVYAIGKDTRFGKYEDLKLDLEKLIVDLNLDNIEISNINEFDKWKEGDIITNSGNLRPIDKTKILKLKPTCIIPLMWETWEFRTEDIDLLECQNNDIAIIGTNESYCDANMYEYPGLMLLKELFEVKVDPVNDNFALIGGGLTGKLANSTFSRLNCNYDWFTIDGEKNSLPYTELKRKLTSSYYNAIIIADHVNKFKIIGKDGFVSFNDIYSQNNSCNIIHLSGNIDKEELINSKLNYYPEYIADVGYMSFLPNNLGPTPVLTLNAAGLKVGEIASKVRLSGGSIEDAIKATLDHGIGQDFNGGYLNYKVNE